MGNGSEGPKYALIGVVGAALFIACGATGCNFPKIQKCHDEMKKSQQAMLELSENREDLSLARSTLSAVKTTLQACREAERTEEVEKITQAEAEITAHVKALEERATREKRPKLTEAELDELEKKGDPTCPRGQQYEHHQDKRLIDCKGPQLFEMNWEQASEYWARRGFVERVDGSKLEFERGAQAITFHYPAAKSTSSARCLEIVADPGIHWQETVTRATGVQPRYLSLDKPVAAGNQKVPLLVEGGPEQYTVKLGDCQPTAGQEAVKEEPKED